MLRNYFKIAFRNLWRNKVFSAITILGLSVSMMFSILIFLWVSDEIHVDQFHENKATLYRVLQTQVYEGKLTCSDATTSLLVEAWKEQMPEVAYATMMSPDVWTLKVGNKIAKMQGSVASEDFFRMFSFPLTQGDPKNCLITADQIVISQKLATAYFQGKNPMGKTIRVDNEKDYFVSGVFQDIPKNSSLQFDFILPYKEYAKAPWAKDWEAIGDKVFVQLKENTDVRKFDAKIRNFLKTKLPDTKDQLSLQACSDMYLHSDLSNGQPNGGRIEWVQLSTPNGATTNGVIRPSGATIGSWGETRNNGRVIRLPPDYILHPWAVVSGTQNIDAPITSLVSQNPADPRADSRLDCVISSWWVRLVPWNSGQPIGDITSNPIICVHSADPYVGRPRFGLSNDDQCVSGIAANRPERLGTEWEQISYGTFTDCPDFHTTQPYSGISSSAFLAGPRPPGYV